MRERALLALAAMALALSVAATAATLDPDRALAASRAAIGSQPRPFAFTDTDGRRVTLADYRGRPLVVSFVYTGCTQVCPTTTRFLARAVRDARLVLGSDAFRVVSIGFNIPSDNPLSMRVFARQHGVEDEGWSFLTPDPGMPDALASDFGFAFEARAGGYEHLTQISILDGQGRIQTQLYGETFALPMLVQPLRALVLGQPAGSAATEWLGRVRLICTVYDPASGRYRLDYALFIEIAAGLSCLGFTLAFLIRERRRARRAC